MKLPKFISVNEKPFYAQIEETRNELLEKYGFAYLKDIFNETLVKNNLTINKLKERLNNDDNDDLFEYNHYPFTPALGYSSKHQLEINKIIDICEGKCDYAQPEEIVEIAAMIGITDPTQLIPHIKPTKTRWKGVIDYKSEYPDEMEINNTPVIDETKIKDVFDKLIAECKDIWSKKCPYYMAKYYTDNADVAQEEINKRINYAGVIMAEFIHVFDDDTKPNSN